MLHQIDQQPLQKHTLTLDEVKSEFTNWRQLPNKSHSIPEDLWKKVITLLPHYGKSKILSTLGISNTQLRKKLQSQQQKNTIFKDKPFVKALVVNTEKQTTTWHDITLTRTNGATLQIQQLSYHDMLNLVNQFAG